MVEKNKKKELSSVGTALWW